MAKTMQSGHTPTGLVYQERTYDSSGSDTLLSLGQMGGGAQERIPENERTDREIKVEINLEVSPTQEHL